MKFVIIIVGVVVLVGMIIKSAFREMEAEAIDDVCPKCGQFAAFFEKQTGNIHGVYTCKCGANWPSSRSL